MALIVIITCSGSKCISKLVILFFVLLLIFLLTLSLRRSIQALSFVLALTRFISFAFVFDTFLFCTLLMLSFFRFTNNLLVLISLYNLMVAFGIIEDFTTCIRYYIFCSSFTFRWRFSRLDGRLHIALDEICLRRSLHIILLRLCFFVIHIIYFLFLNVIVGGVFTSKVKNVIIAVGSGNWWRCSFTGDGSPLTSRFVHFLCTKYMAASHVLFIVFFCIVILFESFTEL